MRISFLLYNKKGRSLVMNLVDYTGYLNNHVDYVKIINKINNKCDYIEIVILEK